VRTKLGKGTVRLRRQTLQQTKKSPGLYSHLLRERLRLGRGRDVRGGAGRILRMAAWPARWQARHMYQLATVR
jgi:hypothetical protein